LACNLAEIRNNLVGISQFCLELKHILQRSRIVRGSVDLLARRNLLLRGLRLLGQQLEVG
jgi:hypothetical protein